jgi:5-methylthioadenosine/S-adenosylhomocysteine deaminase
VLSCPIDSIFATSFGGIMERKKSSTATANADVIEQGAASAAAATPQRGREFTIRNAIVLTMDPALGDFRSGDVHIRNGEISAVGEKLAGGGTSIDGTGFIAMPGLIDTHQHMWISILRGLVGDTAETSYFAWRAKLGPAFTPEHVYRAVRRAMVQAINSGVTTSNNMHHNVRGPDYADATMRAQLEVGQRGMFSYGWADSQAENREIDFADIARLKKAIEADLGNDLVSVGAFLRAPSHSSVDVFLSEYRKARQLGIHICIDGGPQETGGPGIRKLHELGCLGPNMLLVHSPETEKSDRQLLAANDVSFSSSPFTEIDGLAHMPAAIDMAHDGVNVSLSIDNAASPGDSNMFNIARIITNLGRVAAKTPFGFSHKTALQMSTINGARALGIANKVGTLTPGKRADLILVRTHGLNMNPAPDLNPYRLLMVAQTEDVDTVMVDGRILKWGGKLVAFDAHRVIREGAEALEQLMQTVN